MEPMDPSEPMEHVCVEQQPNTIHIYIDYREYKLINEITVLLPSKVTTKNLELGDILIVSTGKFPFTLLFERKANSDLESSIKDHRYSEQKKRILANYNSSKCTYIIEGLAGFGEQPHNIINSAIIHTMYRDNMHVVHTPHVSATAQFIKTVYEKCVANPHYFCTSSVAEGPSQQVDYFSNGYNNRSSISIKSKKSDNIDIKTCYILQLCQIPGISHIIAKEIVALYPTYSSLIDALRQCEDTVAKIKLLKRIPLIADKKAAKIVEYL
jgi:hypothetical protein